MLEFYILIRCQHKAVNKLLVKICQLKVSSTFSLAFSAVLRRDRGSLSSNVFCNKQF